MKLLLIESPGKIRKLKSILGSGWNIKATLGHIVELANDGEDSLGFTLDAERNRVDCNYVPRGTRGKQVLKELRESVKQASEIYIATDPDREGETIGWHVAQQLRLKSPQRVTYSEITEQAVRYALLHPRSLDMDLVAAGRCRDTLDKLVGFKGSPLLWKLSNGAKSMGRVQSAALHILCLREREILAFVPSDYWSVYVGYIEGFRAYYAGTTVSLDSKEAGTDSSDDAADSKEKQVESVRVLSQNQADAIVAQAQSNPHHVVRVDATTTTRKPPAPFITSSLQQAAGSRLKFGSERTMKIAQTLYESGYITYMRTDSVALSDQYQQDARQHLQQHDPQNLPDKVAIQKSSSSAQSAHEAIRPTHVNDTPEILAAKLSDEELKLYELIWNRAIASQCQNAQLQKTCIVTQSGNVFWQARGQVVVFQGYTRYWNDLSSDSQLPSVKQGQVLNLKQSGADSKQTQAPLRYSEPKLVQTMERRGIGRPSTYSSTIKVLSEREYIGSLKGNLQPTKLGMEVDEFLGRVLPDLIQAEFTAGMEAQLDAIANGKQDWEKYLTNWNKTYFAPALEAAYKSLGTSPGSTKRGSAATEVSSVHCLKCDRLMNKIPCHSKKLKADHFLKCPDPKCDTAMFWSEQKQEYELPYSQRQDSSQSSSNEATTAVATQSSTATATKKVSPPVKQEGAVTLTPASITEHSCPVCKQPLELYEYTKENQLRQLLRCSDIQARQQANHKEAVFFPARGVFWSSKYGEIDLAGNANRSSTLR